MNEIKKSIQDMKVKINKDMETLKKNKSELSISIESLVNRIEQVEDRISGMED
jgi:predicted  nucleic acid-binding Zn-ribbon protein